MQFAGLPLHPFIVHFPIALWTTGTLFLCFGWLFRRPNGITFAWWLLTLAAVSSIPAAVSGQTDWTAHSDAGIPALDLHRSIGMVIPWLMGLVVLVRWHLVLTKKPGPKASWIWCVLCIGIVALLLYTSHLGGLLVYREGLVRGISGP